MTQGDALDPEGYTVALDGGTGQPIGLDATIAFDDVTTGDHQVELSGIAPNCGISGGENPRNLTVDPGTVRTTFEVSCEPPAGRIIISTSTAGPNQDSDGYAASVDDGPPRPIGLNGTITLPDVMAGDHTVQLSAVASNCRVAGENPRIAAVSQGGSVGVRFAVSCFPTGTGTLLFASDRTGIGTSHLVRIQEDGSGLTDLTPSRNVFDGDWSPDGQRIAFTMDQPGDPVVAVMQADGSGVLPLGVAGETPRWSPEGSRMVFVSDGTIRVMNADGTHITTLTNGSRPDWSPDGTRIAFDRIDRTRCNFFCPVDLYVMAADGYQIQQLAGDGRCPAWSPDGKAIAYSSFLQGLFLINSDGTGKRQVTNVAGGAR